MGSFITAHLEPKTKVETIYFEGSNLSGEEMMVGYEERINYKNNDELIDFLLNEQ